MPGISRGAPSALFPAEIRQYIQDHHPGCGPKDMAAVLNERFGTAFTTVQIKAYYHNHGISSGLTGHFGKGHPSPNKGKKGTCPKGAEKSWFRPGNLPPRTKPIGYERVRQDGYVEVKVKMRPSQPDRNDNFVMKHRLLWEQANGPLAPGEVLIFKDGNRQHVTLENLMKVTVQERLEMTRRGYHTGNPALTESGALVARLNCTLRTQGKKRKEASS